MACGTGKTFTSLRIAEQMVSDGQRILFAAPTIALVFASSPRMAPADDP